MPESGSKNVFFIKNKFYQKVGEKDNMKHLEVSTTTQEIREYIIDENQGIFPLLDVLTYSELLSLLKSNRLNRSLRKTINHMYMPQRTIREYLPLISVVGITSVVLDLINNGLKRHSPLCYRQSQRMG